MIELIPRNEWWFKMKYFGNYAITLLPGKIQSQAIRTFNSSYIQPSLKKALKHNYLLSENSIRSEKNSFAIHAASYSIQSKKKKYLLKSKNSRTLSEAVSLNYEDKTTEEQHKQISQDDNYALRREFTLECSRPTNRTKYVMNNRNNIEFEEKASSTGNEPHHIQSDCVTASKTKLLNKTKKSIKINIHNTEKVNDTPSIKTDSIENSGSKFITRLKKTSDPSIISNRKRKRNDVEDISVNSTDDVQVGKKLKTKHIPSVPIKSKIFVKNRTNNPKTQFKGVSVSKQALKLYQNLKGKTEKGNIETNTITPDNPKKQSRFSKNYDDDKNIDFKPSILKSKIYPKTVNMAKKIDEINKIKQQFAKKSSYMSLNKFKQEKLTDKYNNDSKKTSIVNEKMKKYEFLPDEKLKEQGKKVAKPSKITDAEDFGLKPENKTNVIAEDFETSRQIENDIENSQNFVQTGCRQAYDIVQTRRHNELEGITSVTPELSWTKQQKLSKLQQVNKETYLANVAKKLDGKSGVIDNDTEQIPKSIKKFKPKIFHSNDPDLSKHHFSLFQHLKKADPKLYPIVLDCAKTVAPSTKREDLTAKKKKIESVVPKFPVVKDSLTLLKYIKAYTGRKHQVALNCAQPSCNSFGDSVTDVKDYFVSKKKQTKRTTIMDLILNRNKQLSEVFIHSNDNTKNKESNESNQQASLSASETDQVENEEAQPTINTYPVQYGLFETEPSMCGSCL